MARLDEREGLISEFLEGRISLHVLEQKLKEHKNIDAIKDSGYDLGNGQGR